MATRTPAQLAVRRRIEGALRIAAPALDLVLAVGDRVSRVAGRNDVDPDPPRRSLRPAARDPLRRGPGGD